MRQTRLCKCCKSSANESSSLGASKGKGLNFLDLPPVIRTRVYEYAGLADNEVIDLNYANFTVYKNAPLHENDTLRVNCTDLTVMLRKVDGDETDGPAWQIDDDFNFIEYDLEDCWLCAPTRRPYQLMFVSKQISKEVQELVYGRNSFRVCRGNPNGLRRLLHLNAVSMSSLSSLTVQLDVSREHSCRLPDWEEISSYYIGHGDHSMSYPKRAAIDSKTKAGKTVLTEWGTFIGRLAKCAVPGKLSLFVIIRATDLQTVNSILGPMSQLPRLQDCGFRCTLESNVNGSIEKYFCPSKSTPRAPDQDSGGEMDGMFKRLGAKLTATHSTFQGGFRYLDLPQELRWLILAFSDLVVNDDVQWRPPGTQGRPPLRICDCSYWYPDDLLEEAGGCVCETPPCNICSKTVCTAYHAESFQRNDECCRKCGPELDVGVCFCTYRQTSFSTACVCQSLDRNWHPLFDVDPQVREDALAVYYSQNKFFVTPRFVASSHILRTESFLWDTANQEGHTVTPLRTDLSLFLTSVPSSALQHIRWVEWVLPIMVDSYLSSHRPTTRAWLDYLDTIDLMQQAMNIPALTLVLNMASARHIRETTWRNANKPSQPIPEHVWSQYAKIAAPLRRLQGLKDFFVHFRRNGISEQPRRVKEIQFQEQRLERFVMGQGYNSMKRGKPRERFEVYTERAIALGNWYFGYE